MRRIALLLVAAGLLSGCGVLTKQDLQPQAPTLSQGRFVYLANKACAHAERRLKGHRKPRSYEEALIDLQKYFIPAYERLLFDLHGLTPPRPKQSAIDACSPASTTRTSSSTTVQALDELQRLRVKAGLHRLHILDRRVAARAEKVGLKTCGKK
jgi:hypothetical protein